MSSEQLMIKFKQIYNRCAHSVDSWVKAKGRLLTEFSAAADAIQQLPALQDPEAFGWAAGLPDFQARLTAHHLHDIERQLASLHTCTSELEAIMRLMDKASASAGQLLATAGGGTLPAASCALAAGATPSLAQCVEGLQDIWRWMRDEWLLVSAAVGEVTYDSTPAQLAGLLGLLSAAPCFSVPRVRDVLLRVLAAAPA